MAESLSNFYLKEWRKNAQLTQEELADKVGLSAPQVSNIERQSSDITVRQLSRFAEALKCQPHDLIMRRPGDMVEILDIWQQLPEDIKPLALRILAQFKQEI